MKVTSYIFVYVLILIAVLQNWLWLAAPLILFFSLRCGAASLIPMAILLDAYFGNYYHLPLLSLASVGWYCLVLILRTRMVNLKLS
ncbi:hypothetical protein KC851_03820 [Candidatus Kaiserbacteria bacterium]|nr:hypothetical protein [Candidatus Kaiserbacteria bacterium]